MVSAKQWAKEEKIDLVFLDESGFATQPNVQRAWSPLGQPHRADVGAYRKRINVLGALDYRLGRLDYALYAHSVKQIDVTIFLERLAEASSPERTTMLVLDNARIHHAIPQEMRDEWLIKYRFCLCFLPTYSPELNLIEMLWKQAKYHWRRFKTWTADRLTAEVTDILDRVGTDFKFSYA